MERITAATEVLAWVVERLFDHQPGMDHAACMTLLEGLTPEQALWRPAADRRCIWEIVLHMAGWREFTARRLAGLKADRPEDWPALPDAAKAAGDELRRGWQAELARLRAIQAMMLDGLRSSSANEPYPVAEVSQFPHWSAVLFMQAHDSYHLGQIAMLRGMQGLAAVE